MSGENHSEPHVKLQITSQPRYLCGARELIQAIAKRIGFDEMSCSQIALALDEALCNVMRHGYQERTDGLIWVDIWATGDEDDVPGLTIVIEDEGGQVDPATIRSRDLDEVRPGGLGVHIIQQIMDSVRYEKREGGRGMRLILNKRLVPQVEASAS